ncbi:hypothetical protein DQ04_07841000 [Trypanosoma grayi]|uniref:hypothetical protein n=1 Tax=Trypanosoma grayi TaxID=71804 RepID=UPI0004F3F390|nr:hypothetical protein DQ04_07841000 [Trypanosoma grayi]KEG08167.1 hypothetical protein DQ04_07841000 [Trypanosoma grayi]
MSQDGRDTVEAFQKDHQVILTLMAHAAMQSVNSRAGEFVFETLCSAEPSLTDTYAEVTVLHEVHQIRRALRNLHECPPHSRPALYETVRNSLRRLHDVLPDPLLLVVLRSIEKLQDSHQVSRALDPYLLDLVEHIQLVVLQETKFLQCRGANITLRLRDAPPFVSRASRSYS